jgi:hypothetical protein
VLDEPMTPKQKKDSLCKNLSRRKILCARI